MAQIQSILFFSEVLSIKLLTMKRQKLDMEVFCILFFSATTCNIPYNVLQLLKTIVVAMITQEQGSRHSRSQNLACALVEQQATDCGAPPGQRRAAQEARVPAGIRSLDLSSGRLLRPERVHSPYVHSRHLIYDPHCNRLLYKGCFYGTLAPQCKRLYRYSTYICMCRAAEARIPTTYYVFRINQSRENEL